MKRFNKLFDSVVTAVVYGVVAVVVATVIGTIFWLGFNAWHINHPGAPWWGYLLHG